MEGGQPLFPSARYVTSQVEFDFWTHPDRAQGPTEGVARLVQANIAPLAEKMTFIKPGEDVVTGITAVDAMGHTPGHMAFHLESGAERLLHFVDACNHYIASMQRPDWHVAFDMDKDKAAAARNRILDMIATDRILSSGYHMPFPSVGYVERMDSAYRWVPVTYQV
jgi:glyoxylase-like metal-dependent hydrolase (beta-lactamase superfamily II)